MLHSINTNPRSLAELGCVQKNLIRRLPRMRLFSGPRMRLVKSRRLTLGLRKRQYAFSVPNDHLFSCAMTLATNGISSKIFRGYPIYVMPCIDFPSQYPSISIIGKKLVTFRCQKHCRRVLEG